MNPKRFGIAGLLLILLLISACATYKTKVAAEDQDPVEINEKSTANLVHSVYLLGDAGGSHLGKTAPTLVALKRHLDEAGELASVLFLGDNIYPEGLPKKSSPGRQAAEWALRVQLDAVKDHSGEVIFIPGNHDWRLGLDGLRRQENYVEDYLDRKNVFLPEKGCAGPVVVELTDELIVCIIDSEWWLQDWDKEPRINADCPVTTRDELIREYVSVLNKYQDQDIIVAFHHPLVTYGSHGGYFSLKDHLFPLTNSVKGLYLPLPVLGSIYPVLRSAAGVKQDNAYKPFQDFAHQIMSRSNSKENLVFVAGHEHNLQLIEKANQVHVVSGSGSKSTPLYKGKNLVFGSTSLGFAVLDSYADGSLQVRFFEVDETGQDQMVFSKELKGPDQSQPDFDYTEYQNINQKVSRSIYDASETTKSGFYRFFWGDWYRTVYGTKIEVPKLDLATMQGGLKPIRRGGGMQTSSLRLEAPDGRQYVIRGMEKDASRTLPSVFRNTFVVDMMRDLFTTAHPYAAFIIPHMADAVGIYHTNPNLYYVPKQPSLAQYNATYGGGLYLFEERPDGDWSDAQQFGRSKDIIGTLDLLQQLEKGEKHRVDQHFVIRNRLFDLTIRDWDRHEDQWRWASFKDKETEITTYQPIPRDRDQAFAKFDGFFTSLATRAVVNLRPMQPFEGFTKKVHWLTWNTRFFDRRFLNELTWEDWKPTVEHIQANLTDEVIMNALKHWPDEVYDLDGDDIYKVISERRDNLSLMAYNYYRHLAKSVDVVGTKKSDYFLVERLDDNRTKIRVYQNDDREKKDQIYERIFQTNETKEIILYGLDGKDDFEVTGEVDRGIVIRLVGGQGKDSFIDKSNVSGSKKHTIVYDDLTDNELEKSKETSDRRSSRRIVNEYLFREHNYNFTLAIPFAAFYSDDGFYIGGIINHQVPQFKKKPVGQNHFFNLNYAFATSAFQFGWKGEFMQALGKWDFLPGLQFQTPRYSKNFYGLGNLTENIEDNDYYRIRHQLLQIQTGFRKRYPSHASISFIPSFEQIKLEQTDERIITSDLVDLRDGIFDSQSYLGAYFMLQHDNKNEVGYPSRGMGFSGHLGWKANLNESDINFFDLGGHLKLYFPLSKNELLVLATMVGTNHNFGDFDFYHGHTLGGLSALRGFRPERFTGRSNFYHSSDIRFPLFQVRGNALPFAVGFTGSFDHGRVWFSEESEDKWHATYGASLWFNFVNAAVIRGGMHFSDDGSRLVIGLGYAF